MTGSARTILTIGSFDGVHVGHRALVETCRRLAREHDRREGLASGATDVVVLAFDPHPASLLRPGTEPARLTSWTTRERLLRQAGADRVVRLEPTPDLLDLSPEAFVDRLVSEFRPVAIVEGADFRFGRGRAGDVGGLRGLGRAKEPTEQFAVHVVDSVTVALGDQTIVTASSTMTRWLLGHGRVGDARRVLGRPYAVQGEVVRGDRRGRALGYPTANVWAESTLPGDGVYAGAAHAWKADGAPVGRFVAAISVGTKPQFAPGQTTRTLEAHLLDARRSPGSPAIAGLPEYGWRIELEFWSFLRDQQRFQSVEALIEQIDRDCARAREAVRLAESMPEATPPDPDPRRTTDTEAAACR